MKNILPVLIVVLLLFNCGKETPTLGVAINDNSVAKDTIDTNMIVDTVDTGITTDSLDTTKIDSSFTEIDTSLYLSFLNFKIGSKYEYNDFYAEVIKSNDSSIILLKVVDSVRFKVIQDTLEGDSIVFDTAYSYQYDNTYVGGYYQYSDIPEQAKEDTIDTLKYNIDSLKFITSSYYNYLFIEGNKKIIDIQGDYCVVRNYIDYYGAYVEDQRSSWTYQKNIGLIKYQAQGRDGPGYTWFDDVYLKKFNGENFIQPTIELDNKTQEFIKKW